MCCYKRNGGRPWPAAISNKELFMEKSHSEAATRIMTGIIIAIVICVVLLFSHIPYVLNTATAFLCIGSIRELHHATFQKKTAWLTAVCCVTALIFMYFPIKAYGRMLAAMFPIGVLLFINLMGQIGKADRIHAETSLCITLVMIMFFRAIIEIRSLNQGFFLLAAAILIGCVTDIGAYEIGKRFGKHKLAPKLSPKKTIEGAVGGTATAFVVLMSVSAIFEKAGLFTVNYLTLSCFIILASIIGQFGDLAMSSIKRISGIKDFSSFMPGHGGFLDRFDSLLLIAPFTCLFCRYIGILYC